MLQDRNPPWSGNSPMLSATVVAGCHASTLFALATGTMTKLPTQAALGFRYRLVSDVPVGHFLSGGVDSSLVCSTPEECRVEIETFNIGFNSTRYDESPAAAAVAQALDFVNRSHVIDEDDAERILHQWHELVTNRSETTPEFRPISSRAWREIESRSLFQPTGVTSSSADTPDTPRRQDAW